MIKVYMANADKVVEIEKSGKIEEVVDGKMEVVICERKVYVVIDVGCEMWKVVECSV